MLVLRKELRGTRSTVSEEHSLFGGGVDATIIDGGVVRGRYTVHNMVSVVGLRLLLQMMMWMRVMRRIQRMSIRVHMMMMMMRITPLTRQRGPQRKARSRHRHLYRHLQQIRQLGDRYAFSSSLGLCLCLRWWCGVNITTRRRAGIRTRSTRERKARPARRRAKVHVHHLCRLRHKLLVLVLVLLVVMRVVMLHPGVLRMRMVRLMEWMLLLLSVVVVVVVVVGRELLVLMMGMRRMRVLMMALLMVGVRLRMLRRVRMGEASLVPIKCMASERIQQRHRR
jgi:hypothetical protein